jgi:hypothetical protein
MSLGGSNHCSATLSMIRESTFAQIILALAEGDLHDSGFDNAVTSNASKFRELAFEGKGPIEACVERGLAGPPQHESAVPKRYFTLNLRPQNRGIYKWDWRWSSETEPDVEVKSQVFRLDTVGV